MWEDNRKQIFFACCIALTVTAMTFAIRAGILGDLGLQFKLTDQQLGNINKMAFWGFPLATILGGLLYNAVGPQKLILCASFCHLIGLVSTVYAQGYMSLMASTFFIGFANGCVEAGANPLIAKLHPSDKSTWLNKFHVWFPGGIVIGALISFFMTKFGYPWEMQIIIMIIPTIWYGYHIYRSGFAKKVATKSTTWENLMNSFKSPLFLFMMLMMTLTATTELGTQQWIEKILGNAGAHPMLVLALITGLMAVGRFYAGPVIHKYNSIGVLLGSALISTVALLMMSQATGFMVYVSAVLFAVGVMYFWPTMIGFIGEYLPETGALGMSLIGGAGMFATGIWQPIIGSWLDDEREAALATGLSQAEANLQAGQATLDNLALFPLVLIIGFGLLYYKMKDVDPPGIEFDFRDL